jgi:histone-lysine N-methyltransferase SETMAR
MIVHADNAGSHVAKCVTEYMNHNSLKRAYHPPYPSDLAPSDFYLCGYVKHQLQGHEFKEGPVFVLVISKVLNQTPTDRLVNDFDDWMRRLQRCVDINGDYLE